MSMIRGLARTTYLLRCALLRPAAECFLPEGRELRSSVVTVSCRIVRDTSLQLPL